jgi:hypothetical protein
MHKFKTVEQVIKKAEQLSNIILFSNDKDKIIKAFAIIKCIITGSCICDICKTWDKNIFVVYEFGRCLFPTRFLQLIKAKYIKTDKWSYIQPLYKDLYDTLYEDIKPDTYDMASLVGENESICKYKLSNSLVTKTIKFIKKKNIMNLKKTMNFINKNKTKSTNKTKKIINNK